MTRQSLLEELPRTFYPVHDGLKRYLKELGLWTDKHGAPVPKTTELIDKYCEANHDAIRGRR